MAWATESTRRIAGWQRQPCGFGVPLVAHERTFAHVKDLELLTKLDDCPRRPHQGRQRSDGHSGTLITETVYRHEIRPVLTTSAISMDKILRKKAASVRATAHLGAPHIKADIHAAPDAAARHPPRDARPSRGS